MAIKLSEFLKVSKELLDFTRCVTIVTKYKEKEFNYRYYSQEVVTMQKKMNSKNITDMVLNKTVDIYFDGTNAADALLKAIKEVTKETGIDPTEDIKKIIIGEGVSNG